MPINLATVASAEFIFAAALLGALIYTLTKLDGPEKSTNIADKAWYPLPTSSVVLQAQVFSNIK